MNNALATYDDGVVFSYLQSDYTPVLAKTDFAGNIVWEKRYANELDPNLTGAEYVTPGTISAIRKDVDGNLIVAQSIRKYGSSEPEPQDVGYAVYMITPAGDMVWTKAYYEGRSDWQDGVNAVDMMVLQDGTIVVEWQLGYAEPGGSMILLDSLDNQGDPICQLHSFDRSEVGNMCLSADQKVVYTSREADWVANTNKTVMYKFNLDGTDIWKQTYYETSGDDADGTPYPVAIHPCLDGGVLVSATISADTANTVRIIFIKTDANGNQQNNLNL